MSKVQDKVLEDGKKLAVKMVKLGPEEVYDDVHDMMVNEITTASDYGKLTAAMLEYFDDEQLALDIYNAIEQAFAEYIDREWYRLCGVTSNGEVDPNKADDEFMR